MKIKNIIATAIAIFILPILSTNALAQSATVNLIETTVTNWRMQDYGDGNIHVFFTSATGTCPAQNNAHLIVPSTMNADSLNRFWSLILSARMTGIVVGVYYLPATCVVQSFYAKGAGE